MKMTNSRVLFVPSYHQSLRALIPVIKILETKYSLYSKVLLRDSMKIEKKFCKANNIDFILLNKKNKATNFTKNLQFEKNNVSVKKIKKYLETNSPVRELYKLLFDAKNYFAGQHLLIKQIMTLIRMETPVAIVVTNEQRVLEFSLTYISKIMNIPVIRLGWSFMGTEESEIHRYKYLLRDSSFRRINKLESILLELINPGMVLKFENSNYTFNNLVRSVITRIMGMPIPKLTTRGKNVNLNLSSSEYEKNILLKNGVNKNKILITGDPSNDEINKGLENRDKFSKQIKEFLKIRNDDIIITIASTGMSINSTITQKQSKDIYNKLVASLLSINSRIKIFIKPHPKEKLSEIDYLFPNNSRIKIITNFSIVTIALQSKLFLTEASSSAIHAIGLGLPVIMFDLCKHNLFQYNELTNGMIKVYDYHSLKQQSERMLFNEKERKKVIMNQRKYINNFAILDGKCAYNNAYAIYNYINNRSIS